MRPPEGERPPRKRDCIADTRISFLFLANGRVSGPSHTADKELITMT
jgi:hypothetical protein